MPRNNNNRRRESPDREEQQGSRRRELSNDSRRASEYARREEPQSRRGENQQGRQGSRRAQEDARSQVISHNEYSFQQQQQNSNNYGSNQNIKLQKQQSQQKVLDMPRSPQPYHYSEEELLKMHHSPARVEYSRQFAGSSNISQQRQPRQDSSRNQNIKSQQHQVSPARNDLSRQQHFDNQNQRVTRSPQQLQQQQHFSRFEQHEEVHREQNLNRGGQQQQQLYRVEQQQQVVRNSPRLQQQNQYRSEQSRQQLYAGEEPYVTHHQQYMQNHQPQWHPSVFEQGLEEFDPDEYLQWQEHQKMIHEQQQQQAQYSQQQVQHSQQIVQQRAVSPRPVVMAQNRQQLQQQPVQQIRRVEHVEHIQQQQPYIAPSQVQRRPVRRFLRAHTLDREMPHQQRLIGHSRRPVFLIDHSVLHECPEHCEVKAVCEKDWDGMHYVHRPLHARHVVRRSHLQQHTQQNIRQGSSSQLHQRSLSPQINRAQFAQEDRTRMHYGYAQGYGYADSDELPQYGAHDWNRSSVQRNQNLREVQQYQSLKHISPQRSPQRGFHGSHHESPIAQRGNAFSSQSQYISEQHQSSQRKPFVLNADHTITSESRRSESIEQRSR